MPILQIGIFEPLNTAERKNFTGNALLSFASKLVSLNHGIQHNKNGESDKAGCDLLSN